MPGVIRVMGAASCPAAYDIRDWLGRSSIKYQWVELNDEDAKKLHLDGITDNRLPIAEFPDGYWQTSASVRSVAERLGWVNKPLQSSYDLAIYGGGPAGLSAAVYAASEGLKTILVEGHSLGGQAGSSSLIENYLGFPRGISGWDLAELARQQAVKFGCEMLQLQQMQGLNFPASAGSVQGFEGYNSEMNVRSKAAIIATGINWRKLNIMDEEKFLGAGVFYGAGATEAPMCRNEVVYVIGAGNSAGQAVMHLADYAKKVVMLVRGKSLADSLSQYLIDKIEKKSNVEVRFDSEVTNVYGDKSLERIQVSNRKRGSIEGYYDTKYLFVCIGGKPNTDWLPDTISKDSAGYILTGMNAMQPGKILPPHLGTIVPGIFAVGDVRHGSIKRVASGVGEGAMAISMVHSYLATL